MENACIYKVLYKKFDDVEWQERGRYYSKQVARIMHNRLVYDGYEVKLEETWIS